TTFAELALTPASFKVVPEDPLREARALPEPLRRVLIGEQGCLQCHTLGGAGGRAHHIRATDGTPGGGFALPFEEYPPDVLRRFLFEQDAVAKEFGVGAIRIDKPVAEELYARVARK